MKEVSHAIRQVEVKRECQKNVEQALESSESCFGSIDGRLEQINVHGKNKFFTIYPDIGPDKVKCVFPTDLHNVAVGGIERRVTVSGELKYRARAAFPHEIRVHSIDLEPSDDDLPTFNDMLGIIPDVEKDTPSEEIIRKIRDEWN